MRLRYFICISFVIAMLGVAFQFMSTSTSQFNLSVALALSLLGLLYFDEEKQIVENGTHFTLYLLFTLMSFVAVNQSTKENFFIAVAGQALVLNLFSEKAADSWQGKVIFSTPLMSTVLFFVLITLESIPSLNSQTVLLLDIEAIAVLNLQELLCLSRQNAKQWAGSFESSLRILSMGFTSYLYGHFFLPQIANQDPVFMTVTTWLAVVALLISIFSLFQSSTEKKQILFSVAFGLLLLWGALVKNSYLVVFAAVVAPWVFLLSRQKHETVFSQLFTFAGPGTVLFIPIVGILIPTGAVKQPGDLVVWGAAFGVFWLGLTRRKVTIAPLSVRQGIMALFTVLLMVAILVGVNFDIVKERF